MKKQISPKDGLRYVTNLELNLMKGSKLAAKQNEASTWTSVKLAEFLQSQGYIRIKYCNQGNPYTYFCLKGIDQDKLHNLIDGNCDLDQNKYKDKISS
ncbi:MAG: hypothetical protein VX642_16020 [Bdellovibrionota bacterium]|nr:hypothetical protein [Bdellovibrionota bacterium]